MQTFLSLIDLFRYNIVPPTLHKMGVVIIINVFHYIFPDQK